MILDGRKVVESKTKELISRVEKLNEKPKLVIIRVGNDFASGKYVANKIKKCEEVGVESEIIHLPEDVSQSEVAYNIKMMNEHSKVTAILLQLPLPKHLDENYLTELISPEKDVDGFTSANMGKLILGQDGNVACTPMGVMSMLKHYDIPLEGKDVLIINRSNIVGKPLAHLLSRENATVTLAHSKTENLKNKIMNSDIVITGVGTPKFLNASDFNFCTTIIDVSINFDENGKICGDVDKKDYDELERMGCNISPVPGGVGLTTVISLIEQTIKIAERKINNGN